MKRLIIYTFNTDEFKKIEAAIMDDYGEEIEVSYVDNFEKVIHCEGLVLIDEAIVGKYDQMVPNTTFMVVVKGNSREKTMKAYRGGALDIIKMPINDIAIEKVKRYFKFTPDTRDK